MMDLAGLYKQYTNFPTITTDSRNIPQNAIYFALKGDRFDGNAFALQALEKGARYAVIDNSDFFLDDRTILVEDSLTALQQLANYHRRQLGIPIIGITGTNGKTTTKELIRSVLSQKYNVWATQGNLNNHIGVPLTLLSMNSNTQIGIVEMGANHPFEIDLLCQIAEPDFGLITNIGKAHLEGFGGFQGVVKTKKELYDFLIGKKGTIFYNSDNVSLAELLKDTQTNLLSYGPTSGKCCKGEIVSVDPFLKVEIEYVQETGKNQKHAIATNLVGDYNFENILSAACIGHYFNVTLDEIGLALGNYTPTNQRSQLFDSGKNRLLLDCYNANPSSTEAAIQNFIKINGHDKLIILGDMLELGEESEAEHLKIIRMLAGLNDIRVILVGKWYKLLSQAYGIPAFAEVGELHDWFLHNPVQRKFILIKGSRGIQLEKLVDML